MDYPKYEKVSEHVIRIISEKADEVPLTHLLQTLKQLEEKKAQIEKTISNINDILKNAKELGISAEETKEENKNA